MKSDSDLVWIVDRAMAQAVQKSGNWLACHPGCSDCCHGPFDITELDSRRLKIGLAALASSDSARAARVQIRAIQALKQTALDHDDPCPALDPENGTCDLYEARPLTCRTFGPPVRCGDAAVGVCELCFHGATDAQITACEVTVDPDGLESTLLNELGNPPATTVAAALAITKPSPC